MLSENNVNIAQYNYNLTQFRAVNSIKTYRKSYDFAIIKNKFINKKKLFKINGKPTKIYKCAESEILFYKSKLYTSLKKRKKEAKKLH